MISGVFGEMKRRIRRRLENFFTVWISIQRLMIKLEFENLVRLSLSIY